MGQDEDADADDTDAESTEDDAGDDSDEAASQWLSGEASQSEVQPQVMSQAREDLPGLLQIIKWVTRWRCTGPCLAAQHAGEPDHLMDSRTGSVPN